MAENIPAASTPEGSAPAQHSPAGGTPAGGPPPAAGPREEIPRFRIAEKKVDSAWKDEVRKEREAAKAGAPASRPAGPLSAAGAPPPAAAAKGAPAAKPAPGQPQGAPAAGPQTSKIFLAFLAQLFQQTLLQLGQMENPYTGQREVDLEGARFSIELLRAIQEKTRGNLSEQETRTLAEAIRELQLQYVEIAQEVGRQMKAQLQRPAKDGPPKGGR